MEDKNPNPSPEDVKPTDGSNSDKQTFEVSKEDFEKLQELEKNKSTALKQEREEKKALAEKLAIYEAKEKEADEKEKLKKWKYEEVLSEKEKLIESLTEKANNWDSYLTQKQEQIKNELTELLNNTDEALLKENEEILTDLSDEKKILFLKRIQSLKAKPDFNWEAWNSEKKKGTEDDIKMEEAKKKGSMHFMTNMFLKN